MDPLNNVPVEDWLAVIEDMRKAQAYFTKYELGNLIGGFADRLEKAIGGHVMSCVSTVPRPARSPTDDKALEDAIMHARDVGRRLGRTECGLAHHQLADWLCELQYQRKRGNMAKMREALEAISARAAIGGEFDPQAYLDEIREIAKAALEAPARNCDMNLTPEEAEAEYAKVCRGRNGCGHECPLWDPEPKVGCTFKWMYATEGGKE